MFGIINQEIKLFLNIISWSTYRPKMDSNQAIERILSSHTFSNKEVLKGLLKFLSDSYTSGQKLKEAEIAVRFFKRGNDFIPGEDTIVRVNVYKLRSLLEKYYQEEGKSDLQIIEIPKGHYTLNFREREPVATKITADWRKPVWILLGAFLLMSVFGNIWLLTHRETDHQAAVNPFWSDYIESGRPVYFTLGDPFFFTVKGKSALNGLIVRDTNINSKEELLNKRDDAAAGVSEERSALGYPYFSRNNLWPLPDLLAVFSRSGVETRLQAISESNIEDIKSNNVVFIANMNSFGFMNKFLERTSLKLLTNPRQIRVDNGKVHLVLRVPEHISGSYEDYAFLVKLPGPNNNLIAMMGDFHASGMKGLSSYISRPSSLHAIQEQITRKFGHFPQYFEMIVKVTSYNYADFETEMVYFNPL